MFTADVVPSNYTCQGCNGVLNIVLGQIPYWVHANSDDAIDCPGINELPNAN